MSTLTVAGGLYHERCIWPDWNRVLGSGGRAAAAVVGHVGAITFRTFASTIAVDKFLPQATIDNLEFCPEDADQFISFEYVHSLSTPVITPSPSRIAKCKTPIRAAAEVVLRFGMLEGTAKVEAERLRLRSAVRKPSGGLRRQRQPCQDAGDRRESTGSVRVRS